MQLDPNATAPASARLIRRGFLRRTGLAALGIALVPALQACTQAAGLMSKPAAASTDTLLLAPGDFPDRKVRQVRSLGRRETSDGGQTAQVVLEDELGQILQSIVIFPSEEAARASVQAIRQGGAGALWEPVPAAPSFGQESAVFVGKQGARDALLAVFRQGPILVRLTRIGTRELSDLETYARKAEEKVQRRSRR